MRAATPFAAFTKAWVEPYMKAGGKAVVDGSNPTSAKVKAMVESGKVTWDALDRNLIAALELGRQNLLEKIDYSIVDKNKVRPEHVGEWGVGSYIYGNVLTYQTDAWGGRKPSTWKDFWNLKDFPGKGLRKHIDGQLEAALLADGVAPDKLYPIDVKRALDKVHRSRTRRSSGRPAPRASRSSATGRSSWAGSGTRGPPWPRRSWAARSTSPSTRAAPGSAPGLSEGQPCRQGRFPIHRLGPGSGRAGGVVQAPRQRTGQPGRGRDGA